MKKATYELKANLWIYPGETANWHFLTVPKKESADISEKFKAFTRGWGSLPVNAMIGKTKWRTSIFPDRKAGTYLLPVKKEVRDREALMADDPVEFTITVLPK